LALEFKNKKVVVIAVPGAFTPVCQVAHISSYTANLDKLQAKGVDQVVVIASNDVWVMAAWGKANGVKDDSIVSWPCFGPTDQDLSYVF
jgi:alkyl hydroperoxide reductase 1